MNLLRRTIRRIQIAKCKTSAIFILHFAFCIFQFLPAIDSRAQEITDNPVAAKDAAAVSTTANEPGTAERVVYEISRLRSYDDERLPAALMIMGVTI